MGPQHRGSGSSRPVVGYPLRVLLLVSCILIFGTVVWFVLGVESISGMGAGEIIAPVPWRALAILASGVGLGLVALWRSRRWYAWVLVAVQLPVAGLVASYLAVTGDPPVQELRVAAGEAFPEWSLVDQTGALRTSRDVRKNAALYIFYRGDW